MAVNPPRPKGPPLNALRAFEAAARLESFTAAADELCVTQGAVAQQIKTLEAWAGAALFERKPQGVTLSAVGRQVCPAMVDAFDALGRATVALQQVASPHRVHIAALPAIAQLWVSPRLPGLRAALPGLEISVTAMEHPPNLAREPFDLAIFFEAESAQTLAQDAIFPVCTPDLARRLSSPEDLMQVPCLCDAVWEQDWATWLSEQGLKLPLRGPVYSLYALAVEEALNGAGVLMGHAPLVRRYLEQGRLVAPFRHQVFTGKALGLRHRGGRPRAELAALIGLLSGESCF
ncbi:LysR substrate-binding domain-containing protein [Shimia sp. SDUM112013]|uniref:LysR substrate-binding domain-containing protein n=1 Tax=Shimia sp. SDUM112013 TaxID=3136160 RepID=UPI0032EF0D34